MKFKILYEKYPGESIKTKSFTTTEGTCNNVTEESTRDIYDDTSPKHSERHLLRHKICDVHTFSRNGTFGKFRKECVNKAFKVIA
jgi:hypothetical protein